MKQIDFIIFPALLVTTVGGYSLFYTPLLTTGTNNWNNGIQVQKQDFSSALYYDVGLANKQGTSTDSNVCKESSGQFPDPKYCDKYYDCWEGRPVSSGQCTHGLMFNEQTSSCDYPKNVNCNGKEVSQPLQDIDEGCEQPYGTFANPRNCKQFTVCHAGRATYYTCEENLAYDKELGVCAPPQDPSCLQQSTNDPGEGDEVSELPLDPDSIKPIPPPGPSGGGDSVQFPVIPGVPHVTKCPTAVSAFLPVAKDCQSVIVCINGMGHFMSCPDGSYFYPPEARCKSGKIYSCEQMNIPLLTLSNMKSYNPLKYGYLTPGYPLLPISSL